MQIEEGTPVYVNSRRVGRTIEGIVVKKSKSIPDAYYVRTDFGFTIVVANRIKVCKDKKKAFCIKMRIY